MRTALCSTAVFLLLTILTSASPTPASQQSENSVVVASLQSFIAPEHVKATPYLAKHTKIDWQFMLVIAIFIGALLSALLARSYKVERVPDLWAWRFGPARAERYIAAFPGGILVLFGARLADGCTSGHGISGSLQFAVSSWVFFVSFFLAALATAFVPFGKEGRKHVNV